MLKSILARRQLLSIFFILLVAGAQTAAQTTQFTYQGSLDSGGLPANGNFDLEFKLYDAASGGAQQGVTVQRLNVTVTNGVFSVTLDFGSAVFTGADRFLETGARPTGTTEPFIAASPRPQVLSVPYSIRSLNSTQLGSVDAGQYVLTTDPRMTDARQPIPGSADYIQNTTAQQPISNFNISGNGTAGGTLSGGSVNAVTQYNLNGAKFVSGPGTNIFVGQNAGMSNTTGTDNAFFGHRAGESNTIAPNNSFFGALAGRFTTTGFSNSFFGTAAGRFNTFGAYNSFFGDRAGDSNTGGSWNSFFGTFSGSTNTTGSKNSLFGSEAGGSNTTGNNNSFFGHRAGRLNTTGSGNSFVGYLAGQANTSGHSNSFFGTETGKATTTGHNNSFFGNYAGPVNTTGGLNTFVGAGAGYSNTSGSNNTMIGCADVASGNLGFATAIGCGAVVSTSNSVVLGRSADTVRIPGYLIVAKLAAGGSTSLCRTILGYLSTCSSSLRYKTDVQPFTGGLNLVNRLRPIAFDWKAGGMRDVGFGAEEVNEIEPLFVTRNDKDEIEGVKYAQLTTILVNAVKEQQAQIETQQKQIEAQQKQIEALKKIICEMNTNAGICKEK